MIGTFQVGIFVQLRDQIQPVFCQKREDGVESLLQMFVRIHQPG